MTASGHPGWKKILYSLSLSLVITNIFIVAKSHSDTPNQPDKNHNTSAVLNAIIEQVSLSDNIKGRFEQRKYIHILPQPLLSKGVFQLDKKTGLVWQINTPVSSRIVFDSAGIHQRQKGQAGWEISNERPGVAMIGELMRAALSYDWALLENYFFINGSINSSINDISETQGGKQQWALTLTPKETTLQKTIKYISLAGEQTLTSLILFEVNNDRTEITFDML
ncbi:MAG: hypothetical protein COA75_10140 [Cellvibrionales bacterium]|nr:MAG: hypothetical protein COA75_10140 [Cellvibrionales bacterium]